MKQNKNEFLDAFALKSLPIQKTVPFWKQQNNRKIIIHFNYKNFTAKFLDIAFNQVLKIICHKNNELAARFHLKSKAHTKISDIRAWFNYCYILNVKNIHEFRNRLNKRVQYFHCRARLRAWAPRKRGMTGVYAPPDFKYNLKKISFYFCLNILLKF